MRLLALGSLLLLALQQNACTFVAADPSGGGLYPPGLVPLINRANVLLASGHFGEAAKIYSEAIEQSPADYLLYYKRATAYLSLQRHSAALEDFDKVLSLTSNTFDNAHLMKARIHLKDGLYDDARHSLAAYLRAKKGVREKDVEELEHDINEGEQLRNKTEKERGAQLWTACMDSATQALRISSHSADIRVWRAECALASGDVESSVADLSRLSHLLQPSTTLLSHVAKLSEFLTPRSPATMNTLKQCLHFDPDSKPCLKLHRLVKGFDRSFKQLDDLLAKEDWKGILKLLVLPGGGKNGNLYQRWEDAIGANLGQSEDIFPLVPPSLLPSSSSRASTSTKKGPQLPQITLPNVQKASPPRQIIVRSLCKSYIHLADIAKSSEEYRKQRERWCEELLTLDGCAEDVDGLVGRGEALIVKQEYEEALRVLDKAFEVSGRSDRVIQGRLQRAHKLLKQSKQKDYYKIVGVSRDADPKTIKKAFRQAAKSAHPDKGGSEAKMAALNEAYEVLSNPELRQRFDNGEDPMDPQQQQQGGNPFQQGGHPFAQFFQGQGGGFPGGGGGFQQGGGGFQWHFSQGH
ncbi:co-chaperone [Coprinopsis marcescibilis]|uniref:Co-chaperone n=1 Tax=Coprinopsis marcescibilis TaxID=230819 RepID=A0A5C3KQM9_COPMA|nr:co-chaperone [Coprinopsis marcescibilis]